MSLAPRQRAQAIAARRGGPHTLAVPLALRLAAKIAERPWEAFLSDPTQLANGLGDLLDAVRPDGVPVTVPGVLTQDREARLGTALEATRRLRVTVGDNAVLLAVLGPGPGLVDTVRAFLDAGVDGVVLEGDVDAADARTIGNVTRFHRAMAHVLGTGNSGLLGAEAVPLDAPVAETGLVLTDGEVPDGTPLPLVEDWVAGVHG
ncbi:hypothetical protein Psed_5915 [Pseudonocardia dioxanivorans CB1190]|uniref:Uncharacterized protein n=1 Tax=Pseudonocardia dioxanivorans (strain ATCC 55486 / DSM 44775 / JCM 13855 / CB1190) TaxID=675635 RepID=F4D1X8_PSEUX|nr:hypothetical protein [Pseudonocardia dioxanivorans]AEA28038.1 hypothetical protein Psed_5915 [Pseudonocardia dioxanivorans CB1190]